MPTNTEQDRSKTAYLDNASTTRLHADVRRLLSDSQDLANPSSLHGPGRRARRVLDDAREQAARVLSVSPERLIFTSGATEANNLAIFGLVRAAEGARRHIVTTAVEHAAVLEPCSELESEGVAVTIVPCDSNGRVAVDAVAEALTANTVLVSVMAANNEVGTLQPVREIAGIARGRGIRVHCDAAQASGKVKLAPIAEAVDALTLSGHKMHGPRGVGLLMIPSDDPAPAALLFGGGQERGLRPGTENVGAAAGFSLALDIAERDIDANRAHMESLRERLHDGLVRSLPDLHVHGPGEDRLPSILSMAVPGLAADALSLNLDGAGIHVSSGSACHAASVEPSHVLRAMALDDEVARGTIRLSVAFDTSDEEIELVVRELPRVVERLRRLAGG